jgi:flagellar basal body-associated protein FliL
MKIIIVASKYKMKTQKGESKLKKKIHSFISNSLKLNKSKVVFVAVND